MNENKRFRGAITPYGIDLRPYDDEGKPVDERDPRDHTNRDREFISLGIGCRKAKRLPVT